MRGPQQPGELRARVSRMTAVETLPAMMDMLKPLLERGLVIRLDPAPGSRAESYAQTLAPTAHALEARPAPALKAYASAATSGALAPSAPTAPAFDSEPFERRIADLEFQVSKLNRQLNALAWKLGEKLES
jgi:uncharacterized protein YceH (UPF0502 family)